MRRVEVVERVGPVGLGRVDRVGHIVTGRAHLRFLMEGRLLPLVIEEVFTLVVWAASSVLRVHDERGAVGLCRGRCVGTQIHDDLLINIRRDAGGVHGVDHAMTEVTPDSLQIHVVERRAVSRDMAVLKEPAGRVTTDTERTAEVSILIRDCHRREENRIAHRLAHHGRGPSRVWVMHLVIEPVTARARIRTHHGVLRMEPSGLRARECEIIERGLNGQTPAGSACEGIGYQHGTDRHTAYQCALAAQRFETTRVVHARLSTEQKSTIGV